MKKTQPKKAVGESKTDKPKWKNQASAENGKLGGRPSGLTDEAINRIENIIENYEYSYDAPVTKYLSDGSTEERMVKVPSPLLTKMQIAKEMGISRFALYEWEGKSTRLDNILKRITIIQEEALSQNSLTGLYDKTTAIFHLKQKKYGGFTDRQELEHSGNITSTIQVYIPAKK